MKYVDIAKGSGLSVSFLYNVRAQDSDSHHMHTVLRVVCGLSKILGEDEEDLFVEYILGEVLGEYPKEVCSTMQDWVDSYKSEEMTYKDLSVRVGIDQTRMSVWFNHGRYPSSQMLRWLIQGMEGSQEEMCRSFFRVAIS